MRRKTFGIPLLVACAAMLSLLASCAPTYDNIADQMLADTQKLVDVGARLFAIDGPSTGNGAAPAEPKPASEIH